jgi:hypothetical protein
LLHSLPRGASTRVKREGRRKRRADPILHAHRDDMDKGFDALDDEDI